MLHRRYRYQVSAWLFAILMLVVGSSESAPSRDQRARAIEIAYRLELELGELDAAQRHVLIWRLIDAHVSGQLTAGASLSDDWLIWQQRLEQLETSLGDASLPTWFEPTRPDSVTAILAFDDPGSTAAYHNPDHSTLLEATAATRLVLDLDQPRLARALMPGLLAWARSHGAEIWSRLLEELDNNPELVPLVEPQIRPWLALPLQSPLDDWVALQDDAARDLKGVRENRDRGDPLWALDQAISVLQSNSLHIDIRDRSRMIQARHAAFLHNDRLDALDHSLLALADSVERLEQGRYVEMMQTLSAIAHINLLRADLLDADTRIMAALDNLSRLDDWLLGQLAAVDGRLLTVYQQLRRLHRDWTHRQTELIGGLRSQMLHDLASLGSVLDLTASDVEGYLAQPFRQSFENRRLVCFGMGGDERVHPPEPIAREDFQECIQQFFIWASENANRVELAGDPSGPFEFQHRARELGLDPFQRINYWHGFMGQVLEGNCENGPPGRLVNPLEWALAARAFVRFSQRWPAYYQAAALDAQLEQMIDDGRALLARWEQMDACRNQGNNPVLTQLSRYEIELDRFANAVDGATAQFRGRRLKPDADVQFDGDAWQATRFRPLDRTVGPCDDVPSCDMTGKLPSSRALFDLFPGPLLVADQIGLGEVSMCYRDVRWLDRRAELPAVRNQAMANYFGRLSFDLFGRYQGMEKPVFRMRLTADQEDQYLFGANSPEVLDDSCPRHLIDTKVESLLPERAIRLVPRRLTYLTADRMHPAKVFDLHWAQGDEWRDRFLTGSGVERLEANGPELEVPKVNTRLTALFQEWNQTVYAQMLTDDPMETDDTTTEIRQVMRALDEAKRTTQAIARVVMPETVKNDPALRASLFGDEALFDQRVALQMRRDAVPVNMIGSMVRSHYRDSLLLWRRASSSRSLPRSRPEEFVVGTLSELVTLRDR